MVRCASLSLRYAPNVRRAQYRVAVVVSRKVHKSAVVRNRIRRRVYEYVRILFGSEPVPYDLLITVHTDSVATLPAEELAQEVEKLLKKAKITTVSDTGSTLEPGT